jgi:hypothetical protein
VNLNPKELVELFEKHSTPIKLLAMDKRDLKMYAAIFSGLITAMILRPLSGKDTM